MGNLSELLNVKSTARKETTSNPSGVSRLYGVSKIKRERQGLGVYGNKSHPLYIIEDALLVLEAGLLSDNVENKITSEVTAQYAVQNILEQFQAQQIELVKAQLKINTQVKRSKKWIAKKSKPMREKHVVDVTQRSLAHRILLSTDTPKTFLYKVFLHTKAVENVNSLSSQSAAQAKKSMKWLKDQSRKCTKPLRIETVRYQWAMAGLKNQAKNPYSNMPFGQEAQGHIDFLERANQVDLTLRIVERQLSEFYAWRKSDVYKQVIKACGDDARHEKRLTAMSLSHG